MGCLLSCFHNSNGQMPWRKQQMNRKYIHGNLTDWLLDTGVIDSELWFMITLLINDPTAALSRSRDVMLSGKRSWLLCGAASTCLPLSPRCQCTPRDKRDRSNLHNFIIDGKKGETIHRLPGTVNGEQIVIQNCEDCNIYIFDHTATISVDDCNNCNVFIGPCKTSAFIRDCKNCKFAIACQQFRTRDCFHIDTFLLCATQPIIESSGRMRFACLQYFYSQLDQHLKSAGLSVFNNNWSNIHDFTPTPEEINFSLLPEDAKVEDYVAIPTDDEFKSLDIRCGVEASVIPLTWGSRHTASNESCLVIFFNDGYSSDRAVKFIGAIKSQYPHCLLTRTKEITLGSEDAYRMTGSESYTKAVGQGPVIGLEVTGASAVLHCQAAMVELMKGSTGLIFVSQSVDAAQQQTEQFFSFADMQMGL